MEFSAEAFWLIEKGEVGWGRSVRGGIITKRWNQIVDSAKCLRNEEKQRRGALRGQEVLKKNKKKLHQTL